MNASTSMDANIHMNQAIKILSSRKNQTIKILSSQPIPNKLLLEIDYKIANPALDKKIPFHDENGQYRTGKVYYNFDHKCNIDKVLESFGVDPMKRCDIEKINNNFTVYRYRKLQVRINDPTPIF